MGNQDRATNERADAPRVRAPENKTLTALHVARQAIVLLNDLATPKQDLRDTLAQIDAAIEANKE